MVKKFEDMTPEEQRQEFERWVELQRASERNIVETLSQGVIKIVNPYLPLGLTQENEDDIEAAIEEFLGDLVAGIES